MEFSGSESWSNHEKEVTGKLVAHEKVTEIHNTQGILKLETGNGHIISICLQQLYLTWKKSFRS